MEDKKITTKQYFEIRKRIYEVQKVAMEQLLDEVGELERQFVESQIANCDDWIQDYTEKLEDYK